MSSTGYTRRKSNLSVEDFLDMCTNDEPDSIIYDTDSAQQVASINAQEDLKDLEELYKISLDTAGNIGLSREMIDERLADIHRYLKECISYVKTEQCIEYDKLCSYQQNQLNDIQKMRKDLSLPEYTLQDNMTLLQKCKHLKKEFDKLDKVRQQRMTSWQELRDKQTRLCLILDIKTPKSVTKTDIPTEQEVSDLRDAVSQLEIEEKRRREKYNKLKGEILSLIFQLEYQPQGEFEQSIDSAIPNYTESHLLGMNNLKVKLEAMQEVIQTKFVKLRETLMSLYERLEVPQVERDRFLKNREVCKPSIIPDIESEIEKYQILKRQNIGKFILKIKEELAIEYERCYISQEEQDGFFALSSITDDCNEQLLELHERELERIKRFYENNKDILAKFARWRQMWKELIELEVKANDPRRFNNRGGNLLMEERKRKALQKGLPKIEAELNSMNEQYAADNGGKKFKVFDTDMDEFITGCWDELNRAKEVEKMERKQAKMAPSRTPRKRPPEMATPTPSKQRNLGGLSNQKLPHNLASSNVTLCEREFDQMISQCPSSAKRVL